MLIYVRQSQVNEIVNLSEIEIPDRIERVARRACEEETQDTSDSEKSSISSFLQDYYKTRSPLPASPTSLSSAVNSPYKHAQPSPEVTGELSPIGGYKNLFSSHSGGRKKARKNRHVGRCKNYSGALKLKMKGKKPGLARNKLDTLHDGRRVNPPQKCKYVAIKSIQAKTCVEKAPETKQGKKVSKKKAKKNRKKKEFKMIPDKFIQEEYCSSLLSLGTDLPKDIVGLVVNFANGGYQVGQLMEMLVPTEDDERPTYYLVKVKKINCDGIRIHFLGMEDDHKGRFFYTKSIEFHLFPPFSHRNFPSEPVYWETTDPNIIQANLEFLSQLGFNNSEETRAVFESFGRNLFLTIHELYLRQHLARSAGN
jgi:hypothetical protein